MQARVLKWHCASPALFNTNRVQTRSVANGRVVPLFFEETTHRKETNLEEK